MLRKLLKYELRANLKIYLFIWPTILAFGLVERLFIANFAVRIRLETLFSTLTAVFFLAIFGACICSLIVSIRRFYMGLLRDEGYLMFTLPVKVWQHILSKLLIAVLTIAITVFVCTTAISIMLDSMFSLQEIFTTNQAGGADVWGYMLSTLLLLLGACSTILEIYLACAIGHLARSKRVFWSILAYFGLTFLIQLLPVDSLFYTVLTGGRQNALGVALAIEGAFCAVYFFFTELILRNRLNLE